MTETRRNSNGVVLGPKLFDDRSYDERQIAGPVASESELNGPDFADQPDERIEVVGDTVDVWAGQFVNRWVFLKHQRPAALEELHELIAEVRKVQL